MKDALGREIKEGQFLVYSIGGNSSIQIGLVIGKPIEDPKNSKFYCQNKIPIIGSYKDGDSLKLNSKPGNLTIPSNVLTLLPGQLKPGVERMFIKWLEEQRKTG